MAGIITGLIIERLPTADHIAFTVAIVLGDAADADGGNVYPSVPRIARLARVSQRTAQVHLRRLETMGFLVKLREGGGRGNPTRYRIDRAWLEGQQTVLDTNPAADAGFGETVQQIKGKPAERAHKRCTNPAAAAAPDPIPVNPKAVVVVNAGGAQTPGTTTASLDSQSANPQPQPTKQPPGEMLGVRCWSDGDRGRVQAMVEHHGQEAVCRVAEALATRLGKLPLPSAVEDELAAQAKTEAARVYASLTQQVVERAALPREEARARAQALKKSLGRASHG